jgi:putative FmdB family regulatory protein
MPVYEYECKDCKHQWEFEHSIKIVMEHCPKCGKKSAKRLISGGTNFQLIGSGWSKDNYGSSK